MDPDRFAAESAPLRRELRAFCYRMCGSATDAEDLVQETYLRAWRSYAGFERRASVRSWLYRIATNVCLTAIDRRRRLPSGLGPAHDGDRAPVVADDVAWLEPLPDDTAADPTTSVIARESLRLALIASLQHLRPAQRAIFLLRDILAFSADETAEILDITVAAVKSSLQRVRAHLDELAPVREELLEPSDPRARALLDGYITAFERGDASLLLDVLRADATLEATPFLDWKAGRAGCIALLANHVLRGPGDWRMHAITANGQPAAAIYRRAPDGALRPDGIVVLAATATGVASVVAFHHDPTLVARFARSGAEHPFGDRVH